MMEKRITAKNVKVKEVKSSTKEARLAKKAVLEAAASKPQQSGPPKVNLKTFDFPVNSKFMTGNVLYTVVKTHKDSNTEWRTVISAVHQDQDYMLDTLRKDAARDPNFIVVELGN